MYNYYDDEDEIPDEGLFDFIEAEDFSPEDHTDIIGPDLPEHLVDADFTLNAPLIVDNVDALVRYLQGHQVEKIFQKAHWNHLKDWLLKSDIANNNWKGSISYHKAVFELYRAKIDTTQFRDFFMYVNGHAKETYPVCEAFFKKWLGRTLSFQDRSNVWENTLQYGSIFADCHKVTILLNLHSSEHTRAAEGSQDVTIYASATFSGIKYKSSIFGDLLIGGGFVFQPNIAQIYDRNMWLMLKDTAGGRFQTLLHIQYKKYPNYHPSHMGIILDVLSKGDELIIKYGQKAYSVIKLVEAMASDRINCVMMNHRRNTPVFSKYTKHVKDSIDALNKELPGSNLFYLAIKRISNIDALITVYGMYRSWGHPFVDYLKGLKKLHENTTMKKEIDEEYAKLLASDLARKVLETMHVKERKWYVDINKIPEGHVLKRHIEANTWPKGGELLEMNGQWADLPLLKCFDVPVTMEPSLIYSDKSYSMNRKQVLEHVKTKNNPIPALRVMNSFLEKPATDWPAFFKRINDEGLSKDECVIGLCAKEREMKAEGRFFALMSWSLREYFVATEFLNKKFFVPLFKGLTMADDLVTVTQKMLTMSEGQGKKSKSLTIANSVDYSKWNNHQRPAAVDPTFKVMGQFVGYPNLFTRTHEFFQKSLIYYKDRPDLMKIDTSNQTLRNRDPNKLVCWEGQDGGLEGLRQKGWSVINYLCLEREKDIRNTDVTILAQGDNQIITMKYLLKFSNTEEEYIQSLEEAVRNNSIIMSAIELGTSKLGLIINQDETLQSYDMLIYGKVMIISGMFRGLHEKRLSRLTGTTNDQFPSLASIMGTVVTNCLTVSHYSDTPLNAIIQYNWLGNFIMSLVEMYNPAMRSSMIPLLPADQNDFREYRIRALYLDPSIGGVSGISLCRFLIRAGPDPISENLSFWKGVYQVAPYWLQQIACRAGNPKILKFRVGHIAKLLESPESLNLPRGTNSSTMLRSHIRRALEQSKEKIQNVMVRDALKLSMDNMQGFLEYLQSIQPIFPRFLSMFASGSYHGLVEDMLRLFENARTIKSRMVKGMGKQVDQIVWRSENTCLKALLGYTSESSGRIWDCSATQSDSKRTMSWGKPVVGATVPHPFELINRFTVDATPCIECNKPGIKSAHIKVYAPGNPDYETRGPFRPYLGSKTTENTNILQPWDKQTSVPILRKAFSALKAITWVTDADSSVAKALLSNVKSITGEDPPEMARGFKRTGSPLHRLECSRQSNGGFSGSSPNLVSYCLVTTDALRILGDDNYDFMHQELILYSQGIFCALSALGETPSNIHVHLDCLQCVRKITEPNLKTPRSYTFPNVTNSLRLWKPADIPWTEEEPVLVLEEGDWLGMKRSEASFHAGRIQGFVFVDQVGWRSQDSGGSLFPEVLKWKVDPKTFLEGLLDGVARGSSVGLLHKISIHKGKLLKESLISSVVSNVNLLVMDSGFISYLDSTPFRNFLRNVRQRIPASYPVTKQEMSRIAAGYLCRLFLQSNLGKGYRTRHEQLWVFADLKTVAIGGPFALSTRVMKILYGDYQRKKTKAELTQYSHMSAGYRSGQLNLDPRLSRGYMVYCPFEIRAAMKSFPDDRCELVVDDEFTIGMEYECGVEYHLVERLPSKTQPHRSLPVPRIQCPLINGMRLPQLATGSHLKLLGILRTFNIKYTRFIAGGDGSGGWGACLLRYDPQAIGFFNSLFMGEELHFRGGDPVPPAAIANMPRSVRIRCKNLESCWEEPSDLASQKTWTYFKTNFPSVDLITLDMEVSSEEMRVRIENLVTLNLTSLLLPSGTLIYKTYISFLLDQTSLLHKIQNKFRDVYICQTHLSGSHTSEVYLVFKSLNQGFFNPTYVDMDPMINWASNRYCFRSDRSEFQRALITNPSATLMGIPIQLIPDVQFEWMGLLTGMGVSGNMATRLSARLSISIQTDLLERVLASIFAACEDIIPTFVEVSPEDAIPSDGKLMKMLSLLIGLYYWVAWIRKDEMFYTKVKKWAQSDITYYFKVYGSTYTAQTVWSFSPFSKRYKMVRMNREQGSIAQVIRLLFRHGDTHQTITNAKKLRSEFKQIDNEFFNLDALSLNTGLLEINNW